MIVQERVGAIMRLVIILLYRVLDPFLIDFFCTKIYTAKKESCTDIRTLKQQISLTPN